MSPSEDQALAERIQLDNRFRLGISATAFLLAIVLHSLGAISNLRLMSYLWVIYNAPYFLVWLWLSPVRMSAGQRRSAGVLRYVLSAIDFAAITVAVRLTGGIESPFFYLYPLPFLVHAFHFDVTLIGFDGAISLLGYASLLWSQRETLSLNTWGRGIGQGAFLLTVIAAALLISKRFQRKDSSVRRSLDALQTTVAVLEDLNALPPGMPWKELQTHIVSCLNQVLKPFQIYSRLWIANNAWKTLEGVGEHPALRPGSVHHLPTVACPAFALRKPFRYSQQKNDPCPSEQFNYTRHLCMPVANEQGCYGVLFLGTYAKREWDPEDLHLFEMLVQSIGLTLHRRHIFESLQEKISELNFSFEVGATTMATFMGSTQGIDETTIHILDGVLSILQVDRASLMLWNLQTEHLQTQWVRGGDFTIQSPIHLAMGEGMAGWALKTGEPYWAEYAMGDPHYVRSAQPIQSLLCVPVYTIEGHPLGVINAVTTRAARAFAPREINFLKWFGRQAALAIENAQLHHKNRANIDELREVSRMKSQFLSLVSHDLRGPLTGIRGFCEVLRHARRGPLNEVQMEVLEQLERQVELQERMVDDLLDLARMEKGQFSIHPGDTDLTALLKEEVEKSLMEAKERKVTLHLAVANLKSMPPIHIDDGRIRQVVWNLIHNALKFTPENGRVVVRAGWFSDETVTVEIEDTGVGLAQDTQDRIFDKFFQITPGGSKGAQGLGLGLAICKEIVLAHHGRIHAQSPGLGLGTTISFTLPLGKPHALKAA